MDIDEIRRRWQRERQGGDASSRRWDAMAPAFYGRELPSFNDDPMLKLVEREGMLGPNSRVLEIGCGAGGACLAMAQRCQSVTGLDISAKMLEYARGEAKRLGLDNADFVQSDWRAENLEARGWSGAFDLVLGWLTPAVIDYESFAKFCSVGRGWYVLGNHVRRAESLSDRFRTLFGLPPAKTAEDDIIFAIAALLRQGKRPQLSYAENEWERTSTFDKLYEKYKQRLASHKEEGQPSPTDDARLRDFLEREIGKSGVLHERHSATIGIVYWQA